MKKINLKIATIITTIILTLNQSMTVFGFNQNNESANNKLSINSSTTNNKSASFSKVSNRLYVQSQIIVKYKDGTENVKKKSTLGKVKPLSVQQAQ